MSDLYIDMDNLNDENVNYINNDHTPIHNHLNHNNNNTNTNSYNTDNDFNTYENISFKKTSPQDAYGIKCWGSNSHGQINTPSNLRAREQKEWTNLTLGVSRSCVIVTGIKDRNKNLSYYNGIF